MKKPIVSIIIPVYNVEPYLDTCIRSVLGQSFADWELILVDDGSTDRSPRICDDYARNDERITVIHKANGGLSSARNVGLDHISGDYVTFLDSDDFWHPDYLQTLLGLCQKYSAEISQCGFVRGTACVFPAIRRSSRVRIYDNHSVFTKQGANIILCGKLFKSSLFEDIRMPVGVINEDDATSWKLYYLASKIVVTSSPLYYYTCNPNGIMAQQSRVPRLDFVDMYVDRIDFFQRRGIRDLLMQTRGHFCLTLMLTACNPNLTSEQYQRVICLFEENRILIRFSKYVPITHRILFAAFSVSPRLCAGMFRMIRK